MDEVDEVDDEADVAEAHSRPGITEAESAAQGQQQQMMRALELSDG